MRQLRTLALSVGGFILGTMPVYADVFTFSFTPGTITDTVSNYNIDTSGATGRARAFHVNGDWTAVSGTPFSNELLASLTGVTNLGGGQLDRLQGGTNDGNPFTFSPPANASANFGSPPEGFLANNAAANLGGIHQLGLTQALFGSTANLANASVTFYTDIVAPIPVSFDTSTATFTRPDDLFTAGTGSYHFQTSNFTAQASGAHHFGLYTNGTDGFLLLYQGNFDPLNPLTNLIGLDDDGDLGLDESSSFWINLTAGTNYVAVSTTFSELTAFPDGLLTIAGPIAAVPEPTTLALVGVLGVGGAGIWYRRRQQANKVFTSNIRR